MLRRRGPRRGTVREGEVWRGLVHNEKSASFRLSPSLLDLFLEQAFLDDLSSCCFAFGTRARVLETNVYSDLLISVCRRHSQVARPGTHRDEKIDIDSIQIPMCVGGYRESTAVSPGVFRVFFDSLPKFLQEKLFLDSKPAHVRRSCHQTRCHPYQHASPRLRHAQSCILIAHSIDVSTDRVD